MMPGSVDIEICEPAPFIYYENGQIAVTDGTAVWLVIVTCEAMRVSASPPEKSLRRLLRYADLYRRLAAEAIDKKEDVEGKVWVTEAMVRAALSSRPIGLPSLGGSRSKPTRGGAHAQHVREYRGHRIAIYSPSDHFAVVTPPGGNRVIDFKGRPARSSVVEGPLVCHDRAQALVDGLSGEADPITSGKSSGCCTGQWTAGPVG